MTVGGCRLRQSRRPGAGGGAGDTRPRQSTGLVGSASPAPCDLPWPPGIGAGAACEGCLWTNSVSSSTPCHWLLAGALPKPGTGPRHVAGPGWTLPLAKFLVRASRAVGTLGRPLVGERRSTYGRPLLPSEGPVRSSDLRLVRPDPRGSSLSVAVAHTGRMRIPGGSSDMPEQRS